MTDPVQLRAREPLSLGSPEDRQAAALEPPIESQVLSTDNGQVLSRMSDQVHPWAESVGDVAGGLVRMAGIGAASIAGGYGAGLLLTQMGLGAGLAYGPLYALGQRLGSGLGAMSAEMTAELLIHQKLHPLTLASVFGVGALRLPLPKLLEGGVAAAVRASAKESVKQLSLAYAVTGAVQAADTARWVATGGVTINRDNPKHLLSLRLTDAPAWLELPSQPPSHGTAPAR